MFEQGLLKIGDDYIAPVSGFFFCKIQETIYKEADKLEGYIEGANIQVYPLSTPFIFMDDYKCILFGANGISCLPVQTRYLEVIGVHLDMLDEYAFWLNQDNMSIMIYDIDGLIGGVMPMAGDIKEGINGYTSEQSAID